MILWLFIAAMTAAASLSILVPLARARKNAGTSAAADQAVYRQQLEEIDRDLERGLIDEAAAEAARTEIARRLLAAHERRDGEEAHVGSMFGVRFTQLLAIVAIPAGALGLYLTLGSPDMPDRPLEERLAAPAENQTIDELVAKAERHLAENPEDGKGWEVLAPIYMRLGNVEAAANAYSNAIRLLGPTPTFLTDMGEALTVANEGIVPANARKAFEEAVKLEPTAVKPRFFIALALGQEGKKDAAIAAWESLLSDADPQAFWVPAAREELRKVSGAAPTTAEAPKGPTREQVEAAGGMNAEDRQAMIQNMVQGLAERLASEGGSAQDWQRLIRAYMVLGENAKAADALGKAKEAFADNAESLSNINAMAAELGLAGQ